MLSVRWATTRRSRTMLCAEHDMRIELDDTTAAGDLLAFLRSFDCRAQVVGANLVEVEFARPRRESRGLPASTESDWTRSSASGTRFTRRRLRRCSTNKPFIPS